MQFIYLIEIDMIHVQELVGTFKYDSKLGPKYYVHYKYMYSPISRSIIEKITYSINLNTGFWC